MSRSIFLILSSIIFILCLSIPGCGPRPKTEERYLEEKLVAKVNDEPITVTRFQDFLRQQKIHATDDPEEDQKKKEEALDKLIKEILIDQKAFLLDLESDSGFLREKEKHMNDFLLAYLRTREVSEKIQVTDEEIKEYYEQHKDEYYTIPEERRIRRLLIKIKADTTQQENEVSLKKAEEEARRRIEELYQRAKAGEDLADLVVQYSEEANRGNRTGDMGYLKRGELTPELDSAAFSLNVGEISAPVRDKRGYNLISVLDIKPKEYREFDEKVARGIRRFLEEQEAQERTREYLEGLKDQTKFAYHDEILEKPGSQVDDDDWTVIIDDQDTIKFDYYASKLSWYKYNTNKDTLTLEDKKDFLRNFLAVPLVLVKEAERRGYRDSVEYYLAERNFTLEEARRRVKAEKIKEDFPPPTREELEAYYQAHKIDYPPLGVPVHVYHIVFDDSLKAVEILNQIKNGADFVELAKKYYPGEPEIREVAYDLGFISQDQMPQSFYEKALSLNVGEVSEPVRTDWGFHLIKVVDKGEGGGTFDDILPEIARDLKTEEKREHMEDWENSLYEEADIWIDKEVLREFQLDKPEG